MKTSKSGTLCPIGIKGLDEILGGGVPADRLYVVQGEPGSGKTTLALEFLMTGVKLKEKVLYITFSETKEELEAVAVSHDWDISQIEMIDLSIIERKLALEGRNTLFHPSELELTQLTDLLMVEIDRVQPERVVIDSVSEMRLLAEQSLRYRKQILELKQSFAGRKITVFFLDDLTGATQDQQVQSIAHGVIELYRLHHDFGGERRRLRILKMRGVNFASGHHDFSIETGGITVYPRMVSSDFTEIPRKEHLSSGITELDALLGGGLDYGTSSLFIGPAGGGKSTMACTFAFSALKDGEKVAYFSFEEGTSNVIERAAAQDVDLSKELAGKKFFLQKVDPAELAPGQFSAAIRNLVLEEKFSVVVIDSLNGYVHAMPQEQYLSLQLHELLAFLNGQGVATIMVLAQQGMIGAMQSPVDLTYLADTVVLTRFFETMGAVKKAVSIIKKRSGAHESTIREFNITARGLQVGQVLRNFHGILTGVPKYLGSEGELMKDLK